MTLLILGYIVGTLLAWSFIGVYENYNWAMERDIYDEDDEEEV